MSREQHQLGSTQSHWYIGILLAIRNRPLGPLKTVDRRLWDYHCTLGGYCLDAYDTMPAGSVAYARIGPSEDDWIASPTTVKRDQP
jgi:hypothetical protein